jgi:excisionase family DNA binding protein
MNNLPSQSDIRPLLTVAELEELLKLHRRTITRLCRVGRLPKPMKVGNSNRWRREDIVELLGKSA